MSDIDTRLEELFKVTLRPEEKLQYEEIKKEIRDQTEFLWRDFSPVAPKYLAFSKEATNIAHVFLRITKMMNVFLEVDMSDPKSKTTKSLTEALQYLTSVETYGDLAANLMLLLLTADGDYVHLEPDREHPYVRHAMRLRDLEAPNFSLGNKINFLSSHGLKFFGKWIKTTLRNRIAHADFDIDPQGNFVIVMENKDGIETRTPYDISKELHIFRMYGNAFLTILNEKTKK